MEEELFIMMKEQLAIREDVEKTTCVFSDSCFALENRINPLERSCSPVVPNGK